MEKKWDLPKLRLYLFEKELFFCLFQSVRFPGGPSPFGEAGKVSACNQNSSLAVWWLSRFDVDKVCVHLGFFLAINYFKS